MTLLRWMFTLEGGARTPLLSAVNASVTSGVILGFLASLRFGQTGGILIGVAILIISFAITYQRFLQVHRANVGHYPPPVRSLRTSLVAIAILLGGIIVGVTLEIIVGALWPLAVVMLVTPLLMAAAHLRSLQADQ